MLGRRKKTNKYVATNLARQNKRIADLCIKLTVSDDVARANSLLAWQYSYYLYDNENKLMNDERLFCQPFLGTQQANLAAGKAASCSKLHNISISTYNGNIKTHPYKGHKIDIDIDNKKREHRRC